MQTVKFDQRIYQENLILKRTLGVTVIAPDDTNDPLMKFSGSTLGTKYLPNANLELTNSPQIKSMLEKKTLFDTIFSDLLSSP
jgi:hypothetical protein